MIRPYKVDFHVHTCLSPCAEPEMRPSAIVQQAQAIGLDGIAICDHNSAENVAIVMKEGKKIGLHVIGGMEITSREEVHILSFFEDYEQLMEMQDIIHAGLEGTNNAVHFGSQEIVDEKGSVIACSDRLLIGATNLPINRIVDAIHDLSGIAVAAHIDRESYSILSQLGFISPDIALDAVELSPKGLADKDQYIDLGLPVISGSDAHMLDRIGRAYTELTLEELSFPELRLAMKASDGRSLRA